ncbi:ABC transporter permease [Candidatus Woesearchaeota archaeon]|nr:ABC transporter permease [Candidatus Woesearchaeota archaeon]
MNRPMLADYFRQGVKNLTQKRLRSILTMIGIFIGVALVVALLSLGQGMQNAIVGQFSNIGAETITVQAAGGGYGPPGSYQSVTIDEEDLKVIKRTPGVEEAFGRTINIGSVTVKGNEEYGYYVSMPEDKGEYDLALTIPTKLAVEKGRLIKPGDSGKIMIGNNIATKDVFGKKLKVGDKIEIGGERFDIVGLLEKTGNPQLDIVFWMMEGDAEDLTGKDNYGLIVVRTEKGKDLDAVKAAIEKALRKSRDVELGKEDFVVTTSQDTIDALNSVLGAVKWFLIGIASISIAVGAVGITNTMYTSVLERTREIGIMKAIGARNSDVLLLFLIESGLLGVVGGIIGIAIGLGLSFTVQAIAQQTLGGDIIKAHISFWLLFGAILGSFILGSAAGVTPARQASRMKPVEALRYG